VQEDLYYPHPLIQDLVWDSLYVFTEPFLTRWPFHKLVRKKALEVTMKHIHYEDENSRYITIGCVEKVTYCCIERGPVSSTSYLIISNTFMNLVFRCYACLLAGLKIPMAIISRNISLGSPIIYGWLKME